MPEVQAQPEFRKFGDHAATRAAVFKNALEAVRNLQPAKNTRYELSIEHPHYAKEDQYSIADHKRALLEGRSLARRLIGTYVLKDVATGGVVDKRRMTVAAIPWLTDHGVFVQDGNSLPISAQMRLLPGPYVRKTRAGRVESHQNFTPGTGLTHHITLDPETGVFKTRIGQAEIPTLPLIRALGVPDDRIKAAWGEVLFDRNVKADKPHHLERYWEKFGPPGPVPDGLDIRQALRDKLTAYPMDPWVVKRTLGIDTDRYGGEPLLASTAKILNVVKGKAEPDERDHPAFSMVLGPEHTLPERLSRAGPYMAKALWAATNTSSLKKVVPGLLNPAVRSLFTKSGLALNAEGNSAAEYVDHGSRITKVGEGGIGKSADSVPDSARDWHPGQYPFIDSIRTSESEAVGIDLRTAFGTRIGSDRRIYAPIIDRKTNRLVYRNPQHLYDATVAMPGVMNGANPVVEVIRNGKLTYAPREEVDYISPAFEQSFSPLTNMVPLKSASKAHRPSMGARYIAQSLPLEDPDSPLVRTQVPNQPGKSFEELYGRHMGPIYADAKRAGTVTEVTPDHVAVRYADGSTVKHELYRAFPTGRKTGMQSYPTVKPGDQLQPGQMLARSNYTDNQGHAAYGKNLSVAFGLDRGHVFEDSVVISQSAANKLRSQHLYHHSVEPDDDMMIDKRAHAAAFGGKHSLEILKTIDDRGTVKPGTIVKYGDPLILAVRRKVGEFGRLSRSGRSGLSDASETWEHHEPGVVEDVIHGPNGPLVTVSTVKAAMDADKVSGAFGNKGVVKVRPDHQMPTDANGKPIEVIFSSLGTISRANPSAIFSSLLGKIAAKTGKPYILSDFDDQGTGHNIGAWVAQEARKHGVKFKENLTDPETGRTIPGVGVGVMHIMKLVHTSEAKQKGRGLGAYDETGQPLRGQSGKAMRSSLGDTNALLGHGATAVIADDHFHKGAANEEFWARFMQGYPVAKPSSSPAFQRFLTELQAAGADPVRKDGRFHIMALTNKRVHELAGDRVVRNGETLDFSRNGEAYPGGLFDPALVGGPDSNSTWAKIPLHEPMLNPVMEDPARRLLGLTEKNFRETLAGRHTISTGTGPRAVAEALGKIDVQADLKRTRELAKSSRKTVREEANRRLFYLKGLEKTGQDPKDWILTAMPVLPPAFRPVRPGGPRGEAIVHDANLVYQDLIHSNSALKELSEVTEDVGQEHLNLYDAMKAVIGLGEPVGAKNRERGVTGVLGRLLGDTSKRSFLQQKLLGTPVNLAGKGVVLPNPDLDMDQVGIPEPVAWEIYHPFIVRRLIRSGVGRVEAAQAVEERSKAAKDHLLAEMGARPVRLTRYPALHRFSTMGFHPVMVPGSAIQTNHMINKGYNLDHDGNCVVYSTEVWLAFDPHLCYQSLHSSAQFVRRDIEDWYMRIVSTEAVYLHDGLAYCRIKIGDMPRLGTPSKDRNGADVYPLPDGLSVLTYDHVVGEVRYAKITHLTVEHDSPCSVVTTRHGHSFTVSDNESVCVFDPETGGLAKIEPAKAMDRYVPRVKAVPSFGTGGSFEEGWWYGVLVADGWVAPRTVGYSKLDDLRRAEFVRVAVDLFGPSTFSLREYRDEAGPGKSKFGRSVKIHLNGSIAARVFNIHAPAVDVEDGRSALRKRLPRELLDRGSRQALLGLFSGLLDGDKTITWNHHSKNKRFVCRFNTSSPHLRDDILQLGLRLGVRMSITVNPANKQHAEAYGISPSLVDLHRIASELRLVDIAGAAGLAEFAAGDAPRDNHDPIPINRELALAIRKLTYPDNMTMYVIAGNASADGYVNRASAKKFLEYHPNHHQADVFRGMVENENVTWEKVVDVESSGKEQVFDLAVPDTKVFVIGNGLVIYDTMTVSVPLSDDAVKETYDKLLPSKNLFSPAGIRVVPFKPMAEYAPGLYHASTHDAGNAPIEFPTRKHAVQAYTSGDPSFGVGTKVKIADES